MVYPIIYGVSTILLMVQDFFHPQYHPRFIFFPGVSLPSRGFILETHLVPLASEF
jgi:hypothetical protein